MCIGRLPAPKTSVDKLWIDLEGNLILVHASHEEFANANGHELDNLFDVGWVRVQNVPLLYLYLDFKVRLNAVQAIAVVRLFEDRLGRIVVEFRGETRSYGDGVEAME